MEHQRSSGCARDDSVGERVYPVRAGQDRQGAGIGHEAVAWILRGIWIAFGWMIATFIVGALALTLHSYVLDMDASASRAVDDAILKYGPGNAAERQRFRELKGMD